MSDENNAMELGRAELIPDFFREFIARIIPGLVVVALCLLWYDCNFKEVFSSATIGFLTIVAAWIIGVILDTGVFCVVFEIKQCLGKTSSTHEDGQRDAKDEFDYLCDSTSWERSYHIKYAAMVIFFRNMLEISAFFTLLQFGRWVICGSSSHLPDLPCGPGLQSLCYFILGTFFCLIFYLCWRAQFKSREIQCEALLEKQRPFLFPKSDIVDLPSFAEKLNHESGIAEKYLKERMSNYARSLLKDYDPSKSKPEELQSALSEELNKFVSGSLPPEHQFSNHITLRPETKSLLRENPCGKQLTRLNRMLIEDAYPLELKKRDISSRR